MPMKKVLSLALLLTPAAAWAKGPVVSVTADWLRNLSHAFWTGFLY